MSAPAVNELGSMIEPFITMPGGLMPALHALQDTYGWIPTGATEQLAKAFNIGIAEVHGVISFYHDFRTTPPGAPIIKMCRGEACQARGAVEAIDQVKAATAGAAEVEDVFCLGNCALGPCRAVSRHRPR